MAILRWGASKPLQCETLTSPQDAWNKKSNTSSNSMKYQKKQWQGQFDIKYVPLLLGLNFALVLALWVMCCAMSKL